MPADQDKVIDDLTVELPALIFSTRDPVIDILAPRALQKLVRLRRRLRAGRTDDARKLTQHELVPALLKLRDMLGELVERRVAPFREWPTVPRVMNCAASFRKPIGRNCSARLSDRQTKAPKS
jgi:hypothetical protein